MKRLLILIFSFLHVLIGNTASETLVLSGGDNPKLNHYSQYLQTKTLYEFLVNQYGKIRVSLYFGAGNNKLQQAILDDMSVYVALSTSDYALLQWGEERETT